MSYKEEIPDGNPVLSIEHYYLFEAENGGW
jgi:hypothetical protein